MAGDDEGFAFVPVIKDLLEVILLLSIDWLHKEDWEDHLLMLRYDLKHGFVKLMALYTLPNGTYRVPQDKVMINAIGIDANVLGGTMVVTGGLNEKLLVFAGNYQSKHRVIATLSFYGRPSESKLVDYDTWTYALTIPILYEKSSDRPQYTKEVWCKGSYFFDTNLGKPIWWTDEKWVDAMGNTVK